MDKFKILIIDDEEVVLDSCTMILEGGDYQINTATDGEQGLNYLCPGLKRFFAHAVPGATKMARRLNKLR